MPANPNVQIFNQDVLKQGGYVYTTTMNLSARLATQRTIDAILETDLFKERSVLDMGCGDGFYTMRFWDNGKPRAMIGVDAAAQAIIIANQNKLNRPIKFAIADAHHLPWVNDSFDLVIIQSILHHDDFPEDLIREAFRLAPIILIHEPNGNNPGLKVIEKLSSYHRAHNERSYHSSQFQRWITQSNGRIVYRRFAGFVPMFCQDWFAKIAKWFEPAIETIPVVRDIASSVVVIIAKRLDYE